MVAAVAAGVAVAADVQPVLVLIAMEQERHRKTQIHPKHARGSQRAGGAWASRHLRSTVACSLPEHAFEQVAASVCTSYTLSVGWYGCRFCGMLRA